MNKEIEVLLNKIKNIKKRSPFFEVDLDGCVLYADDYHGVYDGFLFAEELMEDMYKVIKYLEVKDE